VKLSNVTIAAKLYAIFALLATVTIALAAVAVVNARQHALLTREFEAAFQGAQNVERVNGLIQAVVMESRGIYLAADADTAKSRANALAKFNDRLSEVMKDWGRGLRADEAAQFQDFSGRVRIFQDFRRELVRRAIQVSAQAAREWGDFDDSDSVHMLLSNNLNALAKIYAQRADEVYTKVDRSITSTAWLMTLLGSLAVVLAAFGALLIWRAVARPLATITGVTEAVAAGNKDIAVPYSERRDEIGALARSIAVFQRALRHNDELNHTVQEDAEVRTRRQEHVATEIDRFGSEVEATLSELHRLSGQMLTAAAELSAAADDASTRTAGASGASAEASANVRDIASAATELSASVSEINRQVALSTTIAVKAVSEAERTNGAVKELDEAAGHIGDVIRLITDIAEQTNLLALNATIEAARAGDAGRGFAVVANEVKALSGQTAEATEEIGAQIAGMQRATQRSIEAIGAIERTIREIGDISGAIAAAVTQQAAATEEITRSVGTAAQRTSETAEQVQHVGEATTNTRANAHSVKTVADDLGSVSERVRSQVDHFFQRLRAADAR
jgi:methyl-accepting chemotaxis protein